MIRVRVEGGKGELRPGPLPPTSKGGSICRFAHPSPVPIACGRVVITAGGPGVVIMITAGFDDLGRGLGFLITPSLDL